MCGWHVHMQIICEQCPDVTCRKNHQHRLSRKSFTWSWNETTQHSCDKFHSITSSCHSRQIVQVHADHEEFCRWCADDICACRWHADDIHACGWCADDVQMTYVPADNMRMTYMPADNVQMMSGWHMSSTSQNLQQSLTLVSSAHRLHETSVPRLFSVKEQRTALLIKYE